MATRGSSVYNSMVHFSGASRKCSFYACFLLQNIDGFQTKIIKQNPLEKIFTFTINQNYTLALNLDRISPLSFSIKDINHC